MKCLRFCLKCHPSKVSFQLNLSYHNKCLSKTADARYILDVLILLRYCFDYSIWIWNYSILLYQLYQIQFQLEIIISVWFFGTLILKSFKTILTCLNEQSIYQYGITRIACKIAYNFLCFMRIIMHFVHLKATPN